MGYLILEPNSAAQHYKCWGNFTARFLTPSQQAEAPEASTTAIEGRKQQGIKVERLHQEPEEICHYTVVTEDHRGLTGKLDGRKWKEKKGHPVNYSEGLVSEARCSGNKWWEQCRTGKCARRNFSIQPRTSRPQCHILLWKGCSGLCPHLRTALHPLWTPPQPSGWMWWRAGCGWSSWHNAASYWKIR